MNSIRRIENKKNFESELQFIENICSLDKHKVNLIDNEKSAAYLFRENKTFNFEIEAILEREEKNEDNISFTFDNIILESKKFGNSSNSTNFEKNKSVNFKTVIELKEFHSNDFNTESTYRAYFKVDINDIKRFMENLKQSHINGME